ncbi:hypothetical protein [Alkalicoccus urumqiensis]|uniref:Uncharacterized protein n=1 Tax=Alkalicoccus urumqiensis TaxID=1548213 RepID=A0A2P6MI77_ALKUR|nr:hypothetical protein [Alkalicoccus urumqiensis]PRO65953.1 hypothetical protein C6I21_06520 [Alkalicoccus urumqiensis]
MNEVVIIDRVTEKIYKDDPTLWERYGQRGVDRCREDNEHHLRQLRAAYAVKSPQMVVDYAHWLNGILNRHGMTTAHLTANFRFLQEALREEKTEKAVVFSEYLDEAVHSLEAAE